MPDDKKTNKSIKNVTYIFSHTTLLSALKEWEKEQIEHYPQQKERIQITVVAMQHFLRSKQVMEHKMIMNGDPHDFVIDMPESLDVSRKPDPD